MAEERYPEHQMEFAPVYDHLPEPWVQFLDLREQVLLDYGYNTARAYWADLQDAFEWAVARDKDVLQLTEKEIRQYIGLHRRRKYSESTIRRRVTALRALYDAAAEEMIRSDNPALYVVVPRPR